MMDTVVSYWLMAAGISWAMWSPLIYQHYWHKTVPAPGLFYFLGGIGPITSAVYHAGGWFFLQRMFYDMISMPTHVTLLVYCSLAVIICSILGVALYQRFGGFKVRKVKDNVEAVINKFDPTLFFPIFLFSMVVIVLEEAGWRGYAMPEMLKHHSPLQASVLVGLLWGAWHLPLLTFSEPLYPGRVPLRSLVQHMATYVLALTGMSVLMGYLHVHGGGRVQHACVLHSLFNASVGAFKPKKLEHFTLVYAVLTVLSTWIISML